MRKTRTTDYINPCTTYLVIIIYWLWCFLSS